VRHPTNVGHDSLRSDKKARTAGFPCWREEKSVRPIKRWILPYSGHPGG